MKQWYQELFEDYAGRYEDESFTKGTVGEVDFIEREVECNKSTRILDIGCGTGRHAIELAKRGYAVTGIDLSESMLDKARANAEAAGVRVDFINKDAREFSFPGSFDLAIMLCEGAFSLMETDQMNFSILKNARDALADGGKLIFTTLNGLFPLFHSVKDFINAAAVGATTDKNTFDLMTFRDRSDYTVTGDSGVTRTLNCDERYYVPSEITWLLGSLGFIDIAIHGARLGAFSRDHELTTEDYEMLVIAVKDR